jgi:hypothetical protein
VIAVRDGARGVDPGLLDRLIFDADAVALRPSPLSEQASGPLLVAAIGAAAEPTFAASCFRATAGNSLLLRAIARAVREKVLAPTTADADRVLDLGG